MSTMMVISIALGAAVVGYALGSVIGYKTGRADGAAEASEWYSRRVRTVGTLGTTGK